LTVCAIIGVNWYSGYPSLLSRGNVQQRAD
jgi:hypothetical protein